MATIQYVVNAVNNASRVFSDIADSAVKMGAAFDSAERNANKLTSVLAGQNASARAAADALDKLAASSLAAAAAQKTLADNTGTGAAVARGAFGAWGALWNLWGRRVTLFGGLATVGAVHLLIDGIAEFLAVVVPATLALAAFGVGAAPVIADLAKQIGNLNTVTQAAGAKLGFLNGATTGNIGAFQKLQNAVHPQVYQIFGDALDLISRNSGALQKIATATGTVLDQLAARFVVATQGAGGFLGVIAKGPSNISRIGDIFANLGSILGAFIRAVPGYATVLLALFDAFTMGAAKVAEFLVPVLKIGLALHGAFLYVGLAVSGLFALRAAFTALLASNFAGWVGGVIVRLVGLGVAFSAVAAEEGILAATTAALSAVNPFAWVAIGVAALAGLVFWLSRSQSAAQKFTTAQESIIQGAPGVTSAMHDISDASAAGAVQVAAANKALAETPKYITVFNRFGQAIQVIGPAYQNAAANADQWTAAQKQLNAQNELVNTRVGDLAKTYGSTSTALALLNIAGITGKQITDKSAEAWAILKQQVTGSATAMGAFGKSSGPLARSFQVLNFEATDQYQAMQKVDSAWQTFLGLTDSFSSSVTGSITAFKQLNTDAKVAGATFTGVSNASLKLQNDFSTGLAPALESVIRGMTDAHAPTSKLAEVVATELNPAVTAGALKNDTLRTSIFNMAVQAGYTGPNKIGPLTGFIDKNRTSLQNAASAANKYGAQLARLPSTIATKIKLTAQAQVSVSTGVQHQIPGIRAGHAAGTTGAPPGWAWVGERGPELAYFKGGETVLPAHVSRAVAGTPRGFAGGTASYSGSLPGLTKWLGSEESSVARVLAGAVEQGVRSAMTATSGAVPGGGAPAANAALARRMYPPWGSGMEWNAWNAVAMAESGWNQFARNPSSGAYGIPQALPPSKMGAAANPPQSNPGAQIAWMISYIKSVYGDPIGAAAHENAFHWYGSGFHGSVNRPTLFGAGERGPERVDITPAGQGQRIVLEVRAGDGSAASRFVVDMIQKYVIVHGGDAQAALGQRA